MPLVRIKIVQGAEAYVNPTHVAAVLRDGERVHLRYSNGRQLEVAEPPFEELVQAVADGLIVETIDLSRLTSQTLTTDMHPTSLNISPEKVQEVFGRPAEPAEQDVVEGSCGGGGA